MFEEEDMGAYDFGDDSKAQAGETTLIGLRKQEVVTVDAKVTALKTNYEDPFLDIIQVMKQVPTAGEEEDNLQPYEAPQLIMGATTVAAPTPI